MTEKPSKCHQTAAVLIGLGTPLLFAAARLIAAYRDGAAASERGLAEVAGLISFLVFLAAVARLVAHLTKGKWWSDPLDLCGKAGAVGTAGVMAWLVMIELGISPQDFVWPRGFTGFYIIGS